MSKYFFSKHVLLSIASTLTLFYLGFYHITSTFTLFTVFLMTLYEELFCFDATRLCLKMHYA